MDLWQTLLTAAISAGLTGTIVHLLTSRRDARNRQRDERIAFRIGAYRALAHSVNRPLDPGAHRQAIEDAMDDVLLFGTQEEVEVARQFMVTFASTGRADLDGLLDVLRRNLRAELNESPAPLPPGSRSLRIEA